MPRPLRALEFASGIQLFPYVRLFPRADKLRLMQLLGAELVQEGGVALRTVGAEYLIWTPLNAFDAAETLMKMLQNHHLELHPKRRQLWSLMQNMLY